MLVIRSNNQSSSPYQVSVGVSSNIGGSGISLSSAIVGQPTITAAEGLAFAISLNVVNGFSSSKGGALSRRNYQTQLLQQFSLRRRSLVSDGQIDVSTIKVFLPVAELEAEALDFIKPGSLKLLPSRTNSNTRIVEFK